MPSRKRAKGKARKAKARESNCNLILHNDNVCRHGCDVISKDDVCYKFVEKLEVELKTVTVAMNYNTLLASYNETTERLRARGDYKAIPFNQENQQKLRSLLVNLGTNLLLRDQIDASHLADIVAYSVISLSYPPNNFLLTKSVMTSSKCRNTLRDLESGMPYDCIKFFYRRSLCKCLKEMYSSEKAKKRYSRCYSCNVEKERSQLFLCSNCLLVYYCSVDCQAIHWPKHQRMCKDCRN